MTHGGAVAVLDDDIAEDGSAFLVMELLEGSPVDAIAAAQGGHLSLSMTLSSTCSRRRTSTASCIAT